VCRIPQACVAHSHVDLTDSEELPLVRHQPGRKYDGEWPYRRGLVNCGPLRQDDRMDLGQISQVNPGYTRSPTRTIRTSEAHASVIKTRKVRTMYAAIRRLQEKRANGEEGFTLIELLVVIIIIGILAAIAIPVFLNQRKKGWDSAVKSDLRNAATAQETVFTEVSSYTTNDASLEAVGFKYSGGGNYSGATASIDIPTGSTTQYCMEAISNSGTTWKLSSAGDITTGTC